MDTPTRCSSGAVHACSCEDGGSGTAKCGADGVWRSCQCGGPGTCAAGATLSCTCGDGGTGEQSCNDAGTALGPCRCGPITCSTTNLQASGSVQAGQATIDYSGAAAEATASSRLDVNPGAGGCLATLSATVKARGQGCALTLDFGAVDGTHGGLRHARLVADGYCTGLSAAADGTYETPAGYAPTWFGGFTSVADGTAAMVCSPDITLSFATSVVLYRQDGAALTVHLDGLSLQGDLTSTGDASLQCVSSSSCAGAYYDDGTGWCTNQGCAPGFHAVDSGCAVTCGGGTHDDGTGRACLASGCAAGYHDDGTSTCVKTGCASGFHDDGTGRCVASGCASGYHDDGNGICLARGCAAGYHDDGTGHCVKTGCASGFHDDGTGRCVSAGCATGEHDDGTGQCVKTGCASGYHDDGTGLCVPVGTCATGYHDDGTGRCVPTGKCASGLTADPSGVCRPSCASTATCAFKEKCVSGACVPQTACAPCQGCTGSCSPDDFSACSPGCGAATPVFYVPNGQDCGGPEYVCVGSRCEPNCSVDADCPQGFVCEIPNSGPGVCHPDKAHLVQCYQ